MAGAGLREDVLLCMSFAVPRTLVKLVKTALEERDVADASRKIRIATQHDLSDYDGKYIIASTFPSSESNAANALLDEYSLSGQVDTLIEEKAAAHNVQPLSGIEVAIREWSQGQPHLSPVEIEALISDIPKTYSIYGPMLLLSQHAFQSEIWTNAINVKLYDTISKHMKVSHIAINAPIPLQNVKIAQRDSAHDANILRSPTNLTPLYGDFGPICTSSVPTAADFANAFWCHTKQNGITQIWAPRYTMFSRGNITEKARVLGMSSVAQAVSSSPDIGCCAVDLYTGIGYFTFSYLAAGVKKVLGWDLNPWSIEGLKRGAVANGWGVATYSAAVQNEDIPLDDETRLVAFVESNDFTLRRIEAIRGKLPPIRHVNCGLLPSSSHSYATAAAALDPQLGGWVHVHENFAVAEIEARAEQVQERFQDLMQDLDNTRGFCGDANGINRCVLIEHVQRVKSYAPGVFHCVVDVFIPAVE